MLRRCTVLASFPRSLVRPRPVLFSPLAPSLPPPSLAVCTPLNPSPLLGVRFGSRKAGSIGVKTKSAVKKRFRVNGGGTLKRMCSGKRHLNIHKSSAQIHRLGAWCGEEEEPFLGEHFNLSSWVLLNFFYLGLALDHLAIRGYTPSPASSSDYFFFPLSPPTPSQLLFCPLSTNRGTKEHFCKGSTEELSQSYGVEPL